MQASVRGPDVAIATRIIVAEKHILGLMIVLRQGREGTAFTVTPRTERCGIEPNSVPITIATVWGCLLFMFYYLFLSRF